MIAIPNLLRAKSSANSASAVSSMAAINVASGLFFQANSAYPADLGVLGPAAAGVVPGTTDAAPADLLDSVLSGNLNQGTVTAPSTKSGYKFFYTAGTGNATYTVVACPIATTPQNQNAYYTDQTSVIRVDTSGTTCDATGPATATSNPI